MNFTKTIFLIFILGAVKGFSQTNVSTYSELTNAISNASSGAVISLTNDIVISAEISTNKTFTLNGNGYTLTVPVPGMNSQGKVNASASNFRVLKLTNGANVTVNHLTFKGGKVTTTNYQGGAIRVETGATVRLNSCVISDSASNPVASGCSGAGGGIAIYGTAYLYDCSIKRNAATYAGGILVNAGVMYMDKSTVSENRTTSFCGGGGAEIQGTVYINNSTFSNNTGNQGGSLQAGGGTAAGIVYIMNSSFTGNVNRTNSLDDAALAVYLTTSKIYAVNCVFAHNYAGNNATNPSSFILSDAGNYSAGTIQVLHSILHQPSNTMSSGVTSTNNIFYTGAINGSDNTIFSGGVLSKVLSDTGDEIGTAEVYRPFLYTDNTATAPTLKTGSFLSQSANKGVPTRFNHNNNSSPVFSYFNGTSWVALGTASVGSESDVVSVDQSGVTRSNPPTRGAVESEVSNLYYVKVNSNNDGVVNGGTIYGDVYPAGTSVALTAIPNTGKQFVRWDYVTGGTGTASSNNPYTFTVTQDVTLVPVYAATAAGAYSITYLGNGHTSGDAPPTESYTAATTIYNQWTLIRSGYNFIGWNTNPNGSGTSYVEDASYSAGINLTLYAQWQAKATNIYIGSNNGLWSIASNWSLNHIPTEEENVSITANTVVMDVDYLNESSSILSLSNTGGIIVNPNKTLTINGSADFGNRPVLFKSDATGYGQLGKVSGTITGATNVQSENYVAALRAYRLLTSPVTTTTSIRDNWQEGSNNTSLGYANNQNPNPGFGTHITGSATGLNGFDATATGNPSLYTFTNATQAWSAIANTNNTALTVGQPYRLMVRGDRSIDLSTNTPNATHTVLRATGTLQVGDLSTTLSATANHYNLVANPYQSPIYANALFGSSSNYTNVNNQFFYVWDHQLGLRGAYSTITVASGTATGGSTHTNKINPWEAFFVKTGVDGASSLVFKESYKNVPMAMMRSSNTPTSNSSLTLNLKGLQTNGSYNYVDGIRLDFGADYSLAIDQFDAEKFINLDEDVAIQKQNQLLTVERRAIPTATETVPLQVTKYRSTSYVFENQAVGLDGVQAFLKDNYTNTLHELEGTPYAFTVNTAIPASIQVNRFELVFQATALGNSDFANEIAVYPNPSKGSTGFYITGIPANTKVELFSLLGQSLPLQTALNGSTLHVQPMGHVGHGVYVVQVTTNEGLTQQVKWIVD